MFRVADNININCLHIPINTGKEQLPVAKRRHSGSVNIGRMPENYCRETSQEISRYSPSFPNEGEGIVVQFFTIRN